MIRILVKAASFSTAGVTLSFCNAIFLTSVVGFAGYGELMLLIATASICGISMIIFLSLWLS